MLSGEAAGVISGVMLGVICLAKWPALVKGGERRREEMPVES